MVCLYFINLATTNLNYWYSYNVPGFPWMSMPKLLCALLVLFNVKVNIFGIILALLAAWDASQLIYHQLYLWIVNGQELYFNELMFKKTSMMGSVVMILINDPYFKTSIDRTSKAFQGLVLKDEPKYAISQKLSISLLIVRILMSTLCFFIGYGEIKRQLALNYSTDIFGHHHARPPGDGHDNIWPKLLEFTLAIPFVIGFKMRMSSLLLAAVMLAEAFIYWQFWNTTLGVGYAIHARDHFSVNVGVAGGLAMLQSFGAGRYSVDELLKKND